MMPWLSQLFAELHREHLKPLGFKKVRQTFSRDRGAYWERFNFQGSHWNAGDDWTFYLNVGVEFKDLGPPRYCSYLVNTHWGGRVGALVPDAPNEWTGNIWMEAEPLKAQLHDFIVRASAVLAERADEFRAEYLARLAEIEGR